MRLRSRLALILLLLILSYRSWAQAARYVPPPGAKLPTLDNPSAEDYKVSEQEFLAYYGASDTAAAIIHLYLRRHAAAMTVFTVTSTLGMAAGIVDRAVSAPRVVPGGGIEYPDHQPWVAPVVAVTTPTMVGSLVYSLLWSRRSCYRVLRNYRTVGPQSLPRKVRRRLPKALVRVYQLAAQEQAEAAVN